MRCCHCGKTIPDTKEICPYCGHLQLEIEVKDANRRRTMRVLLGVLLIVAVIAGIVFFLRYKPVKAEPPVPTVDPLAGYLVSVTPRPEVAATAEPVETTAPAAEPTAEPTVESTVDVTAEPTTEPTAEPTAEPTSEPTAEPIVAPTAEPTAEPAVAATAEPTPEPTAEPTPVPTERPRPGKDDIAGMRLPFVAPKKDSWLSDYEIVYANPNHKGRGVFLLNSPSNLNFICGVVYAGLPQTALARENGHTLIRTDDGRLGWVKTYLLTEGTLLYPETTPVAETTPVVETAQTETNPEPSATTQPTVIDQSAETPAPAVQNTVQSAATEEPSVQSVTQSANNAIANAVDNVLSHVSDSLTKTYVADISSAIFHTTDCSKVGEISDVYRWENTKSREELLRLGYEPCSVCKP